MSIYLCEGYSATFIIIMAVCQKELVEISMRHDVICYHLLVITCALNSQSGQFTWPAAYIHTYFKIGQGFLPYLHIALKYRIMSHLLYTCISFVLQYRKLNFSLPNGHLGWKKFDLITVNRCNEALNFLIFTCTPPPYEILYKSHSVRLSVLHGWFA